MLDDRKKMILKSVISEYIRTGEPVGSKLIAESGLLTVSAATIRNDMAVLEQLGYLEQPHTSAGRIPTYTAFSLYIEEFMPEYILTEADKAVLDDYIEEAEPTAESLLASASHALAELTRCAVIRRDLVPQFSVITKVEVVPTGKRMYVILLISSNGAVKNKVCRLEFDLTDEQIKFFANYMSENLHGISLDELTTEMFEKLIAAMSGYMVSMTPLLEEVKKLADDFNASGIAIEGEKNLLMREDIDAKAVEKFIARKDLTDFLDRSFGDLQVVLGGTGEMAVSNTGLIMSKIKKNGVDAGTLGLLGPLRLDYSKIIPYIEYLTGRITEIISDEMEIG
ncbi:MAG: heat-inducible transcriptional repressor HrcA [Ruminococcus sp.]|nr:heat-inducible transcriptional repressor HrcA [Ruminococcus sp.]